MAEKDKEVEVSKEFLPKKIPHKKKAPGTKLTDKMRTLCNEYMIDLNKTQAVLRAGYNTKYPSKMADQLFAHPEVKKEIARLMEIRQQQNEVTARYVITKLVNIVEETETSNPQAALRGLELLGKHLGLYRDRQEISGPDGEAIKMEQQTKEAVNDFTRKLKRLAGTDQPRDEAGEDAGSGAKRVVELSRRRSES